MESDNFRTFPIFFWKKKKKKKERTLSMVIEWGRSIKTTHFLFVWCVRSFHRRLSPIWWTQRAFIIIETQSESRRFLVYPRLALALCVTNGSVSSKKTKQNKMWNRQVPITFQSWSETRNPIQNAKHKPVTIFCFFFATQPLSLSLSLSLVHFYAIGWAVLSFL